MAPNNPQSPPGMPLKLRLLIAAYTFISKAARRPDGTLNRSLLELIDRKAPPSAEPIDGVISSDIVMDPSRDLWFRLYIPSGSSSSSSSLSLPLLVYFHGGGFSTHAANSASYDAFCRRIVGELPVVLVSVNYRRSPDHRFPCQHEDGIDTLKFIEEKLQQNDSILPSCTDVTRCFLIGDSAGGNIAHHMAVRADMCKFMKLRIIGLICLQPFFSGEERTESELRLRKAIMLTLESADWMWKAFLPEGSNRDHQVANVTGPNAIDISAITFPATLIVVGGYDLLQDQQRRYYEWLRKSGKKVQLLEYPNAIHGFYAFPEFPESLMAITEVKKFIQKQESS